MVQDAITVISTLGFPIACVLGMAFFIWQVYKNYTATSKEREDKLYDMIGECQTTNEELLKTNASFVAVIEKYNEDLSAIRTDVAVIKDYFEFNKKDGD